MFQAITPSTKVKLSLALLSSNLKEVVSNTSVMLTPVALEGPLLVIVIAKVTLSPTLTLSGVAVLTTVKLTFGSAVTFAVPLLSLPSLGLANAVLLNVPLVFTFTRTHTLVMLLLGRLSTFHMIL